MMPPNTRGVCDADRQIAITHFTPERFRSSPQVGLTVTQEWHGLLRWLAWPSFADNKQAEGAWCPCALEGGRVKGGTGSVSLLVGDVDECGPGALDRTTELLRTSAGAVIPTFSATREKPKHRIVLLLDRPLTADEFPIAWRKFNRRMSAHGVTLDQGCKNINRLYFACVARSPAAWLGARILTGQPLTVDRMLAVARAEEAAAERERQSVVVPIRETGSRYFDAAISRECGAVASAPPGARNNELNRAAFALSRLAIPDGRIESSLLDAAKRAGLPESEARKTISSALKARRGAL